MCLKLHKTVRSSNKMTFAQKYDAMFSWSSNFIMTLFAVGTVLQLPLFISGFFLANSLLFYLVWGALALISCVAPLAFYTFSSMAVNHGRFCMKNFYLVVIAYSGISVTGTFAVIEAVLGKKSDFIRTPKSGSLDSSAKKARYKLKCSNPVPGIIELLFGVMATVNLICMLMIELSGLFAAVQYFFCIFVGLYALGLYIFGYDTISSSLGSLKKSSTSPNEHTGHTSRIEEASDSVM